MCAKKKRKQKFEA